MPGISFIESVELSLTNSGRLYNIFVQSFMSERLRGVSLLGRKSTSNIPIEKCTLAEHQNNTNYK